MTEEPLTTEQAQAEMHRLAKLPDAQRILEMKQMPRQHVADITEAALIENLNYAATHRLDPEAPPPPSQAVGPAITLVQNHEQNPLRYVAFRRLSAVR